MTDDDRYELIAAHLSDPFVKKAFLELVNQYKSLLGALCVVVFHARREVEPLPDMSHSAIIMLALETIVIVVKERDECRAGYTRLDQDWDKHYERSMGMIRTALEMPDETIPELVERINTLKALQAAQKGQAN